MFYIPHSIRTFGHHSVGVQAVTDLEAASRCKVRQSFLEKVGGGLKDLGALGRLATGISTGELVITQLCEVFTAGRIFEVATAKTIVTTSSSKAQLPQRVFCYVKALARFLRVV